MTDLGSEEIKDGHSNCEGCGFNFPDEEMKEGRDGCMYCDTCFDKAFELLNQEKQWRLDRGQRAAIERVRDILKTDWPNCYSVVGPLLTTALDAAPADVPKDNEVALAKIVKRALEIFDKHKLDGPLGGSVTMTCLDKLDELLKAPPGYVAAAKVAEVGDEVARRANYGGYNSTERQTYAYAAKLITALLRAAGPADVPRGIDRVKVAEVRDNVNEEKRQWNQVRQRPRGGKEYAEGKYQAYRELSHDLTALLDAAGPQEPVVPVRDEDTRLADWIRRSVKPTPRPIWVDEEGDYYIKHPAFEDVFVSDSCAPGRPATEQEPINVSQYKSYDGEKPTSMMDPPPTPPKGLYNKFTVTRNDGRDAPGEKHHGCEYFVLDLTHDKYARKAARAYAQWTRHLNQELSDDLRAKANDIQYGDPESLMPEAIAAMKAAATPPPAPPVSIEQRQAYMYYCAEECGRIYPADAIKIMAGLQDGFIRAHLAERDEWGDRGE